MKIYRKDEGARTTLSIVGVLDAIVAQDFSQVVDQVVADGQLDVVVDVVELRRIDNTGIGVLVSLHRQMQAKKGVMRIIGLREQPRAVFKLLRLDRIFSVTFD